MSGAMSQTLPQFPRGFTSWYKTFYEMTAYITQNMFQSTVPELLIDLHSEYDQEGLYKLSYALTNEFESLYKDIDWEVGDKEDYYIALERFLYDRLKQPYLSLLDYVGI